MDRILLGMDIPATISFISSLATIFGFALAINVYWSWRHKDTKTEQAKLVRGILMNLAELEMNLKISMDVAILHEMESNETLYPHPLQRTRLSKIGCLTEDINLLTLKFHSIEPVKHDTIQNNSETRRQKFEK